MMAWTVDKAKEMRRLAEMHSDIMICTNRPDIWGDTFWKPEEIFNLKGRELKSKWLLILITYIVLDVTTFCMRRSWAIRSLRSR